MRSPGSSAPIEWVLRLVAVVAIAAALREAWQQPVDRVGRRDVTSGALSAALREASRDTLRVRTDTALQALARDWLAARRDAGGAIQWSGDVPPIAVAIDPPREPGGSTRLLVSAPAGRSIVVRDSLGLIDSTRVPGDASLIDLGRPLGTPSVRFGTQRLTVRAAQGDSARAVVVIGRVGWESKFVVAALEEQGWQVITRLAVRPELAITQGELTAFDRSTSSVVIALDESAVPFAGRIASFVRGGGGLVLGGEAMRSEAFAALRPGAAGVSVDPMVLAVTDSAPRRALRFTSIVRPVTDAVVLERQRGAVAMAARRVGQGRVVAAGYADSWRWRMTGPDGAEGSYRRWWSGLVAAAAGETTLSPAGRVQATAAPRVAMVATLGAPVAVGSVANESLPGPAPRRRWALIAIAALVVEWGLRRVRGAR
jgi:hypothetical protein